jgi:hypothetical protein
MLRCLAAVLHAPQRAACGLYKRIYILFLSTTSEPHNDQGNNHLCRPLAGLKVIKKKLVRKALDIIRKLSDGEIKGREKEVEASEEEASECAAAI